MINKVYQFTSKEFQGEGIRGGRKREGELINFLSLKRGAYWEGGGGGGGRVNRGFTVSKSSKPDSLKPPWLHSEALKFPLSSLSLKTLTES